MGITTDMVDMSNMDHVRAAIRPSTKLVWIESPTNPLLKVIDIAAVCECVHKISADVVIVVDNTFMSPYFQRPLQLGANVIVHSITKYINGHSDVVMGCVMTSDDAIAKHLVYTQLGECRASCTASVPAVGAVPSPFDCYLVNRGVKTLHVRMRAHAENGRRVAEWLESNGRVERVFYPELPSHPQHAIHKRQAKGMSGMVSFYLRGGLAQSQTFLSALKVFTLAESLGGFESLAELP